MAEVPVLAMSESVLLTGFWLITGSGSANQLRGFLYQCLVTYLSLISVPQALTLVSSLTYGLSLCSFGFYKEHRFSCLLNPCLTACFLTNVVKR